MHLSGNLNDLQTAWNCSCKLQTVQCRWYFKRWGHVSGCTTQKCLSKLLLLAGDGASWTRNIYTTHKKYLTSGGWRPSWSHLQEASPPAQQAAVSTNTAGREFPFHLHVWLPLSWFSFDPLRAWKTHDDHQHSSSTTQENLITTGFSAVGPWSLSVHSLYFQSIFLLFYGVFALLLSWLNVLIFYSISKLL